jgi:hypothetical protein
MGSRSCGLVLNKIFTEIISEDKNNNTEIVCELHLSLDKSNSVPVLTLLQLKPQKIKKKHLR